MTVNEAFDIGLRRQQERGISPNTLRVYRSQCKPFRQSFGDVETDRIDAWEVEAAMSRWPMSPKSRQQVMKITQSLMDNSNADCPWLAKVKSPYSREVTRRDWLRPEQIITVLNFAYRMGSLKVFAIQLFAGLSRAEVLPLRWKNVSGQFLRVQETMIVTDNGPEIMPRTKCPSRFRIVPLCPFLQDLLRYERGGDEDFVSANPDGKPITVAQYLYAQRLMYSLAGFAVGHEMRHTFATLMSLTGIPDHMRKQLMGHAATGITDRVYTHQWAEAAIPYVARMERLAFGEEEMPTLVPQDWL